MYLKVEKEKKYLNLLYFINVSTKFAFFSIMEKSQISKGLTPLKVKKKYFDTPKYLKLFKGASIPQKNVMEGHFHV